VQLDLRPEAALHPLDQDLDVDLAKPGDDLVAGLGVAVDVEGRVLLAQPPHRGRRLLLVALRLRFVRERHHRRRQVERGDREVMLAVAEDVAGARLLQLRDGADVAGPQLGDRLQIFSQRLTDLADSLLLAPAHVYRLGV
jgi:hypothetical protein